MYMYIYIYVYVYVYIYTHKYIYHYYYEGSIKALFRLYYGKAPLRLYLDTVEALLRTYLERERERERERKRVLLHK